MLTCKQATELASRNLDEPLTFKQRLGLKFHLMICSLCRAYERHIRFIKRASPQIDKHIESQTQHKLPETAKARIKQQLKD